MTGESIFFLVVMLAAIFAAVMFPSVSIRGSSPTSLPDHDLKERRVTPTSTAWEHSHACGQCCEKIGHQEWMTNICLSCGRDARSGILPPSSAWRKVVRGGAWVDHARIEGRDYLRIDGVMKPVDSEAAL